MNTEVLYALPEFRTGAIWASPLGFSKYLVSTDGNVISLQFKKPKVLKPIMRGKYPGFCLIADDGSRNGVYLHRLVIELFVGPGPEGHEVAHEDGNRFNAALSNLRWKTRRDNSHDKYRHGTALLGEKHPHAKLTEKQVAEMRELRARTSKPFKDIAAMYGVTAMTAHRAITGKCWNNQGADK